MLQTAVWVTNPVEVRIMWANAAAVALWKAESLEELINRDNAGTSETARQTLLHVARRVASGVQFTSHRTIYPLGEPVLVEMKVGAFPVSDDFVGLLVEARELEDRPIDPDVLRGAETARYAPVCLATFGLDGALRTSNAMMRGTFGLRGAFRELFLEGMVGDNLLQLLQGRVELDERLRMKTVAGVKSFRLLARQLPDPVTGEMMIVLSLQDASSRIQLERLEEKNQILYFANRELSEFASIVSHDLKAPLRMLQTHVDFAQESLASEDFADCEENLSIIKRRSIRMQGLIDEFLEYAKAVEEKGEVRTLSFPAFVEDIWSFLGPPEGSQLVIESEVTSMTTFATPLKRVFLNLLGNTLKHHHQPGQACVTVRMVEEAGYYICEVEDNGPGIPEGQTERVFGMFQTLHSATSRSLGSGMGLALVRRIVQMYGGAIQVESEWGRGALFRFEWPVLQVTQGVSSE